MKKLTLLSIIIVTITISHFSYSQTLNVGDKYATLNFGPGLNYDGFSPNGFAPASAFSFEYGLGEIGPGVVSLGGMLGFTRIKAQTDNDFNWVVWEPYEVKRNYHNLILAAKSSWHYNFGQLGIRDLNAYLGTALGVRFVIISEKYEGPVSPDHHKKKNRVGAYYAFFGGASYNFSPTWSVFVEGGYSLSYAAIGLIYRFS